MVEGVEDTKLSVEARYNLITRNLQEVLGDNRMKELLKKDRFSVYWGTATTGKPHLAYFVPMTKIGDFLRAGCDVTILLADLHGFLDNMKAPWDLLMLRTQYYEHAIKAMLSSIGIPLEKLHFVRGTDYQLSKSYTLDMYRLTSLVSEHDAKKAGAEVVKQVAHPMLSGLLYPGLQALDEEYLKCDAQFGGVDQRKIFTFAERYMPLLGYKKRVHLMNPMVPGLSGGKMSSSDDDSKIDLLDSLPVIKKKLSKSFCEPGNVENNGVLSFFRYVVFPLLHDKPFVLERTPENGGNAVFNSYVEIEGAFADFKVHPGDLKDALALHVDKLLAPVRKVFEDSEMEKLATLAYPAVVKVKSNASLVSDSPRRLDLRVGVVDNIQPNIEIPSVHIAHLDIGDEFGTNVAVPSGIVGWFGVGTRTVVLCNSQEEKVGSVDVGGVLMRIRNTAGVDIKYSVPPNASAGDRVYVEDFDVGEPDTALSLKKKPWKKYFAEMHISSSGLLVWRDNKVMCDAGPIAVSSTQT